MSKGDYKVGKGRPPIHTRFKKGQSGNPSGRKKMPDPNEAAARVLDQNVSVTQDGVRKRMLAIDAVFNKTLAMALNGNMRAAEFLIGHACNDNARRPDDEGAQPGDIADADIIERHYARRLGTRGEHE